MSNSKKSTDARILEQIYDDYVDEFERIADATDESESKVYLSINIPALAKKLEINKHVLFGRLYYHLDKKYRYMDEESGAWTHLFAKVVGSKKHCIHFPYLSAVVAEQQREIRRFLIPLLMTWGFAILAVIISLVSLWQKSGGR
jgi:hypothetical protein